jgi:hypothetical protein
MYPARERIQVSEAVIQGYSRILMGLRGKVAFEGVMVR